MNSIIYNFFSIFITIINILFFSREKKIIFTRIIIIRSYIATFPPIFKKLLIILISSTIKSIFYIILFLLLLYYLDISLGSSLLYLFRYKGSRMYFAIHNILIYL